ncbi:MAG: relaxase/mobilization nuclease domain-containing protein [Alphaproteobacteria bacterium]|nr:relaxase/mobilization nuclease domain-containing protein [Alphaproteobacteria bacterium]
MIIKGGRRGGARQLAAHLLRRDTNEDVIIHEIDSYPVKALNDDGLKSTLRLMAVQGQTKGKLRTLYHSIIAPQQGETLNKRQLKHAVDTLAKNLGMEGHPRVIVEHRKDGRQHFHVVFNILNPTTGKQARLQWTRKVEWNTSRQLEQELGLKPVMRKGRAARRWEYERGKRSGIKAMTVRKDVTSIYHASKTGKEFISNLNKAGYVLTKGRNNNYVLVDRAGDIHGLMRRIEGVRLKDLRQKFPDLKQAALPSLNSVLKKLRPVPLGKKAGRYIRNAAYICRRPAKTFVSPQHYWPILRSSLPFMRPLARVTYRPSYEDRKKSLQYAAWPIFRRRKRKKKDENEPVKLKPNLAEIEKALLLEWAWDNKRWDILVQYYPELLRMLEP